jgi:hypothetical protein
MNYFCAIIVFKLVLLNIFLQQPIRVSLLSSLLSLNLTKGNCLAAAKVFFSYVVKEGIKQCLIIKTITDEENRYFLNSGVGLIGSTYGLRHNF